MTTEAEIDLIDRGALGERPALLLVNLTRGYTDSQSPLGVDADAVVDANVTLTEAFLQLGLPVFACNSVITDDQAGAVLRNRRRARNIMTLNSHWARLDERIQSCFQGDVITTAHESVFFDTDLADRLRACEVDSLVIAGLTTSGSVRASIVDALQHGFPVVLAKDCVADRDRETNLANLYDIQNQYADVMPMVELLLILPG